MRAQALDQQRLRLSATCERMTSVTRTPSLGQHARDVERVVAAADHGDMGAQIGIRFADRGWTEVDAARRREPSRVLDLVEPVLAAELGSGRDHQCRPRQGPYICLGRRK